MAKGFSFKQFHVNDHGCGMPVSTDGVLLGAWADLSRKGLIVDIGTGSGLLALMAAQRTHTQGNLITAVEIDPAAAEAALQNFQHSPWPDALSLTQQDIRQWAKTQEQGTVTSVICNPPYFNSGEQANCQARATARHTDSLPHIELLEALRFLLADDGIASLILPTYEGEQLLQQAEQTGLYCQRRCDVRTSASKPVSRLLIALTPVQTATRHEQLVIHEHGHYSAAFTALTRDFYLKM
ncbi:SAM-dependent methyltransferase [Photobacterium aquae]|uniref:tRNA1(Val) (adenine(37)-N6)-methyltransferase n=1 Tax=Photobacterium aquae TaxID=1195763 RepID=A0A0J1GXL0_9GAMM|nr:methyltransferase [Photobacterium aquae]KLV04403.1 SAM-dependent methyltransferase [Photobacterium aquae]